MYSMDCDCINDCESVSFTLFENTEQLDPDDLCRQRLIQHDLGIVKVTF